MAKLVMSWDEHREWAVAIPNTSGPVEEAIEIGRSAEQALIQSGITHRMGIDYTSIRFTIEED